ncbi:MAG TPA: sensor histidine kinase [Pseudoxanthomonas sp.]|nr:sensor histidine kinase [Pseudoxanthomonas sp.]
MSNLLTNAVTHGEAGMPIRVEASSAGGRFTLAVSNRGTLSLENTERLFLPFTRSVSDQPRPGLGLGLYIATEIAPAHGGTLTVSAKEGETRFDFGLPCQAGDVSV